MNYLKSLIKSGSGDSSRSFALIISVLVGAFIGLIVAFVLVYDIITNGYIKTDMGELGTLLLCVGGYMVGGGINKVVSGSSKKNKVNKRKNDDNDLEINIDNNYYHQEQNN